MSVETPLDRAHAKMQSASDHDAARLGFYERLADAELFLLLAQPPVGEEVEPEVFDLQAHSYVLVFDREDRLSEFTGQISPYVALSGRAVIAMLVDQKLGLGVNLDVAPSQMLLPPEAIGWLSQTLAQTAEEVSLQPMAFYTPADIPQAVLESLDSKLVSAAGLVKEVWLTSVTYAGDQRGHLLAFIDAVAGAEPALTRAAQEALTFSGIEAGSIDVGFFSSEDKVYQPLAAHGLGFDLPQPEPAVAQNPSAPGRDPAKPPILR